MNYTYFCSWIPAVCSFSPNDLSKICQMLEIHKYEDCESDPFPLACVDGSESGKGACICLANDSKDIRLWVHESGLFIMERKSEESIDERSSLDECDPIYERIKRGLHIHIFTHRITPGASVLHSLRESDEKITVRQLALELVNKLKD